MKAKSFFGNWVVKNILGAVLLIAALLTAAYFLLKIITNHNREIMVPDLTNMTLGEAQSTVEARGMRIQVVDSVYVRRMERGAVYRQTPKAGSHVKKGRRILLTINAVNPKSVTMPNLVGYSMRQAKAELLSRGLQLGRLIYVDDIATNNVLKQLYLNREIEPGTTIESESAIDLVVGLNSSDDITYIPDLLGVRYMSAIDALHDNSLNVRNVVFDRTVTDYSDSLNAVVYKQVPDISEASFPMGSEVTIYLSTDRNRVPHRGLAESEEN